MMIEVALEAHQADRRYVYDKYNLYNISDIKLN